MSAHVLKLESYRPSPQQSKRRQSYLYQCSCLFKATGKSTVDSLTQADIDQFREAAKQSGLANRTIEAAIKAAGILRGEKFTGEKLRIPHSRPQTIPLADLSKVHELFRSRGSHLMARFLKWAYITGFRLEDLRKLRRDQMAKDVIELSANKTGKLHLIPKHPILSCRLPDCELPLKLNPHSIRKKLRKFSDIAGVPYFTPQMIRATAGDRYEAAWPGAGGVLLGHSLGTVTMQSYVQQETILRRAQENLEIPESMLSQDQRKEKSRRERQLVSNFRRMSAEDREALLRMTGKMS